MASSKQIFSLSLIFFFQLHTIFANNNPQLFHICSTSQANFTSSSPYQSKLTTLLKHITSDKSTLLSKSFTTATVDPTSPGPTYALAQCRGDVSASDCLSCAKNATHDIRELCPDSEGAIVWYDDCLLKYSDSSFLGKIDDANKFYMWNTMSVTSPKLFNEKTKEMLGKLTEEAIERSTLFATTELKLDTFTKLYGLVQCTRDLSKSDCKTCLDEAITELPSCCDGKQGGRVVGGSCNFRYEIYPFVNM